MKLSQIGPVVKATSGALLFMVCTSAVAQASTLRIMPLGDSITAGYNVPGGYRTALYNLLKNDGYNFTFVGSMSDNPSPSLPLLNHEGHAGWRTIDLSSYIDGWLDAADPDVILLHIGTNDLSWGVTAKVAMLRLSSLVGQITTRKPDAQLIVASIVPRLDGLETTSQSYNQMIPTVVSMFSSQGKHVTFLDMHSALTTADLGDVVHPNDSGYDKMAHAWLPAIQSVAPPPVPEPATLLTLFAGSALLMRKRRR